MKAYVANPIYDACFKFLMEDETVAKYLLSALLKKEIISVKMRNREFASSEERKISMYRIDFSALVRNADGTEQHIIIEIQKSWVKTEILRFRKYLGLQYLNKENIVEDSRTSYGNAGIPIVSIYILGHTLIDVKEPVIYVRRSYLDYDDNELHGRDSFIESLTHDSIVVQIPCLPVKNRNRLEKLLRFFDQRNQVDDGHVLEFELDDIELEEDAAVKTLFHRLTMAAASPEIRKDMDIEDEILMEIEARDVTIIEKDKTIELRNKTIELKDKTIEQKDITIKQKDITIKQKDITIKQKDIAIEQKDIAIEQKDKDIEQKDKVIFSAVKAFSEMGLTQKQIAENLSISEARVEEILISL